MNKEYYKLRNYNEEGLRLRNKKKYLLQKQYLLELQKQKQEALLELQENKQKRK